MSLESPPSESRQDRQEAQWEISPEDLARAEAAIFATLDLESKEMLEILPELLQEQVKTLPRYQELEKKMEGVPSAQLFHEVHKAISRQADPPREAAGPDDGVLLSSMRRGPLECAGRVLIASTFLREKGVPHSVAAPPGHSMLLQEVDEDTFAYADPNNDVYFTFPKEALRGYAGREKTAECALADYVPREKDVVDGEGSARVLFLVMSPRLGVTRSYLNNVQAALDGHEEFKNSGIQKDEKAADAVDLLKKKILPADDVLENWESRQDDLKKEESEKDTLAREAIADILRKKPEEAEFVAHLVAALDGMVGEKFPYLRHASEEAKTAWAEKVWQKIQSRPDLLEPMS